MSPRKLLQKVVKSNCFIIMEHRATHRLAEAMSWPLPSKGIGTLRGETVPWVSVNEGAKESMLLAARSVARSLSLVSALV